MSDLPEVIHFQRPGGCQIITNFRSEPVALPEGKVFVTSAEFVDGKLRPRICRCCGRDP